MLFEKCQVSGIVDLRGVEQSLRYKTVQQPRIRQYEIVA